MALVWSSVISNSITASPSCTDFTVKPKSEAMGMGGCPDSIIFRT